MPDPTNPYLELLQAKPRASFWDILGNTLLGAGAGISQAGAQGRGWGSGIGPGLMMGNQMTAQAEHQAEQERMRRFQLGIQASEWDEKRQERLREQAAIDAYTKQPPLGFNATAPTVQMAPQPPPDGTAGTTGKPPYQLGPTVASAEDANRLSQMESGGRYDAIGPVANKAGNRAYGKYQIMDFNIGPWTQEVLGRTMTPQEFLADTKAQDAVFNAKFGAYKQKYGPGGAARAWFAGEGGMNNPNARDVLGTSVAGYEQRFLGSGPSGPPAPQVAQGGGGGPPSAPPAGPLSMPQFATLPPFAGPGLGNTIQPGATDQPTLVQGGGEGPTPQITLPPLGFDNRSMPSQSAQAPPPQQQVPVPPPVQPNYTPTPGTPSMAPGGGPDAPPVRVRRPPVTLPPELNDRINAGVAAKVYTRQQADTLKHQLVTEEQRRRDAEDDAQHAAQMKTWEVNRQTAGENRRAEAEQKRYERDAAERQKAREDAAKQSGDKLSFEQTKAQREDENKLRDDMNGIQQVKDFRKADLVFQSAQKAAKTNTAAADLNLVYAFATMMDPGSVVRDQETGMVIATQNASDRIKALVSTVSGGSRLQEEAKAALIAEMASRHSAYKESHDAFASAFEEIATRRGLDPRNVVMRVVVEKDKEAKPSGGPLYNKNGQEIKQP